MSLDEDVKLTSWNVNSLGDRQKTRNILNKLNREPSNIICLVDTRTSTETEHIYQQATKHKLYFNSLRSDARGITILVKDTCPITDITQEIVIQGNLTKLNFTHKEEKWTIAALYAPNTKNLEFFHTLFEAELDPNTQHILYAGDWNVSLSQELDTSGYIHENNTQNRDLVKNKMTELQLRDIWRDRNPHATNFTFMKKQARNTTKARLDFFLTNPQTAGYIQAVRIGSLTSLSDHRPISCTIVKNKAESGPGCCDSRGHSWQQDSVFECILKLQINTLSVCRKNNMKHTSIPLAIYQLLLYLVFSAAVTTPPGLQLLPESWAGVAAGPTAIGPWASSGKPASAFSELG